MADPITTTQASLQARALTVPAGRVNRALWSATVRMRGRWGAAAAMADPHTLVLLLRYLCLTIVLSAVDAALTLWQVAVHPGFTDLNPVTQAFISAGMPWGIVLMKLASLTFAAVVFLRFYTRPAVLLAARIALLINLWVACHWILYLAGYVLG